MLNIIESTALIGPHEKIGHHDNSMIWGRSNRVDKKGVAPFDGQDFGIGIVVIGTTKARGLQSRTRSDSFCGYPKFSVGLPFCMGRNKGELV